MLPESLVSLVLVTLEKSLLLCTWAGVLGEPKIYHKPNKDYEGEFQVHIFIVQKSLKDSEYLSLPKGRTRREGSFPCPTLWRDMTVPYPIPPSPVMHTSSQYYYMWTDAQRTRKRRSKNLVCCSRFFPSSSQSPPSLRLEEMCSTCAWSRVFRESFVCLWERVVEKEWFASNLHDFSPRFAPTARWGWLAGK